MLNEWHGAGLQTGECGTKRAPGRSTVMNENPIRSALTRIGVLTARPEAFLVVVVYAIGWAIFEPVTLDWHGYAVLATWLMTLFIQRAEHRDTQAIHAKLDELLRAQPEARNEVIRMDDSEPEDIEHIRAEGREQN